jgi:hypothetical protein
VRVFYNVVLARKARACENSLSAGHGVESLRAPGKEFERLREVVMSLFDLAKATLVCGGVSFLVYSFPAISQGLIIGLLTVVWVSYAQKLIRRFVQR